MGTDALTDEVAPAVRRTRRKARTVGSCTTAATRSATGIDVRVASAPSGGPPATWPIALAWLFIDSTVARDDDSRLRLSHVAWIGALKALLALCSHSAARTSHRLSRRATPTTATTCAADASATGSPGFSSTTRAGSQRLLAPDASREMTEPTSANTVNATAGSLPRNAGMSNVS